MRRQSGDAPSVRRIDKILAFTSLGILVVAVGCFVSTIIAGAVGVTDYGGAWRVVFAVQLYGPILAFALLISLLIVSFVRRGRANRR